MKRTLRKPVAAISTAGMVLVVAIIWSFWPRLHSTAMPLATTANAPTSAVNEFVSSPDQPSCENQPSSGHRHHEREAHFQLLGGRIVYVPFNEFVGEVRELIQQTAPKFRDEDEITETMGPLGDFNVLCTFSKVELSEQEATETGRAGTYIALSEFRFVPLSAEVGEPVAEVMNRRSNFRGILDGFDPKSFTITVWIYPDSIDEFGSVYDGLDALGYDVATRSMPDFRYIGGILNPRRIENAVRR